MKLLSTLRSQRGMALFIALMLTLMLTIVGLGIIQSSNDEITIAGNELQEMKTFYAAEAGLDRAIAAIQSYYEAEQKPPTVMPSDTVQVGHVTVEYFATEGDTATKVLNKGPLAGLSGATKQFVLESTAIDVLNGTSMTLTETFEVALVPIFQFSVFYENDLEIAPGPDMILLGRIHSNRDVYLQSNNSIQIDSYFTAFGDIHHGRKPGSGQSDSNGDVDIMGIDGNFHSMREGSGWLESSDPHWFDSSIARWGGRVQDAAYGQERLNLPLDNPMNPYSIIERDGGSNDDSFENQATLKIMDGDAFFHNGASWINVTDTLMTLGALDTVTFRDRRESQDVLSYDIDMGVLKETAFFPPNGIMYASDNGSGYHATRLKNADEILNSAGTNTDGFTLATDMPVYTQGDINSVNKVPMAIITDALTVLSNNWDDANSSLSTGDRQATTTTTNFSYITGNVETGGGNYNGGLENLPHFLETWSGDTLHYTGSMINLWESQKGDSYPSEYSPPFRNWAFDNDLSDPNKLPPGTPVVRTFVRMGWRQTNVGYVYSGEEVVTEP